jgi:hypothetical protein
MADDCESEWSCRSGWFLGGFGATSGGVRFLVRIFFSASEVKMTVVDEALVERFRVSHSEKKIRKNGEIICR